jgi:hypothetical protein
MIWQIVFPNLTNSICGVLIFYTPAVNCIRFQSTVLNIYATLFSLQSWCSGHRHYFRIQWTWVRVPWTCELNKMGIKKLLPLLYLHLYFSFITQITILFKRYYAGYPNVVWWEIPLGKSRVGKSCFWEKSLLQFLGKVVWGKSRSGKCRLGKRRGTV